MASFDPVPRPWTQFHDETVPPIRGGADTFKFFFLDVEYRTVFPRQRRGQQRRGVVPEIYIYGKTKSGAPVVLVVHEYLPYFYVDAPPHMRADQADEYVRALKEHVARHCKHGGVKRRANSTHDVVVRAELVHRRVFYMYDPEPSPKVKVYCNDPYHIKSVAEVAQRGGFIVGGEEVPHARRVYECNLPYLSQFLIDMELKGCQWIVLRAGTYRMHDRVREFHTPLCYQIQARDFEVLADCDDIPPLRQLFFDIECYIPRGSLLDPASGPVIQIASLVYELNRDEPLEQQCLTLRTCAPVPGTRVVTFPEASDEREHAFQCSALLEWLNAERDALFALLGSYECEKLEERLTYTEREYTSLEVQEVRMLMAWRALVLDSKADILGGYNSIGFDMWFLTGRAELLGIGPLFECISRRRTCVCHPRNQNFSSKQSGEGKQFMVAEIPGVVQLDMMVAVQADHKLRSNKLNAVASHFLGDQKEDMPYDMIVPCFDGSDVERRRLVTYCVKDALLPYQLACKLNTVIGLVEGVRVRGITMQWLVLRGQGVSVISGIKRYSNKYGFIWPVLDQTFSDEQFPGGAVLEPVRGYYNEPVVVEDFKGLYPSIIRAHNLCYSTLITKEQADKMDPNDYTCSPMGAYFVKPHVFPGILPALLTDWTNERDAVKKRMKQVQDPFLRNVLDGRQLGIKVSSNSVYGFTGARIGKLPCLAISCSVTAFGREMIGTCKQVVETHCTVANGWPADAETLYGDTDSVMVRFGGSCQTVAEAFKWGAKLEALLNEQFIAPIEMEMEKVYYPWLLFNKKRYAGVMYEDARNPDKMSKIDVKGIESKRRDNCLLTSQTQKRALDLLLVDRDTAAAEALLRDVVTRLRQNQIDMSQLVISKQYARSEYKTKTAHVELIKRIRQRDPGAVPKLGDRVPYVMVKTGSKKAPGYEKCEDPLYAMENGIPIDDDWYLENQLKKPMELVYLPLLGEKRTHELLYGAHTRKRVKPTPRKALGGIMRFAEKKPTCASCRAVIHNAKDAVHHVHCEDARPLLFRCSMQAVVQAMEPTDGADKQLPVLCVHCAQKEDVVYVQERKVQQLAQEFHQCWSYCQTCQDERYSALSCTAVSCPIFYKRVRVARDWEEQRGRLSAMHAFDW